jgi:hypothetical protein
MFSKSRISTQVKCICILYATSKYKRKHRICCIGLQCLFHGSNSQYCKHFFWVRHINFKFIKPHEDNQDWNTKKSRRKIKYGGHAQRTRLNVGPELSPWSCEWVEGSYKGYGTVLRNAKLRVSKLALRFTQLHKNKKFCENGIHKLFFWKGSALSQSKRQTEKSVYLFQIEVI